VLLALVVAVTAGSEYALAVVDPLETYAVAHLR
jgi:hypothetical protein